MAKLYIDTNVIVDAVEGRKNKFKKNIGNPASDLFYDTISCKHNIVLSAWTLKELAGLGKLSSAKMFLEVIKKKVIPVSYTDDEKLAADKRSKTHSDDALHIIIAEREKSDCIVTRNTEHFEEVGTIIPIRKPEELL
jgi:predicted nucleic acid-binding protein